MFALATEIKHGGSSLKRGVQRREFSIQEVCQTLGRIVFTAQQRNVLYLVVAQTDVSDKPGSLRSYPVSLPEAYI